ncbi:MFS transporter [Gammaproteobacteria bacterium]|nr:MFS transporter [Gammaproteobacteria bacterium]
MKNLSYNQKTFMVISLTFTSLLGFPVIAPALPAVRGALNISTENIGWVMAAYSAPGIIFIPLVGLIADRIGKRKVLLPSLFLFALCGTACMYASDQETLFFFRFLQGISACALSTINVSMAADYFKGHERVKMMGYIGATQNIGSGLLPMVGGALAAIMWFYPFATSLLALPIGIYLIFQLDEIQSKDNATKSNTTIFLQHAWSKLNDRVVIELVFMTGGFIFIGFGAFITYLPLFLNDTFNSPAIVIGIVVGSRAMMGVLMASQLSRLASYFSYRSLICFAFLFLASGLVIIPFATNQWFLIYTAICYGGSFGILRPSLQYLLIEHAPDDLRSTFASAINFGLRVSQTISPVCVGLLLSISNYKQLYILAAILAVLMTIYASKAVSLDKVN